MNFLAIMGFVKNKRTPFELSVRKSTPINASVARNAVCCVKGMEEVGLLDHLPIHGLRLFDR